MERPLSDLIGIHADYDIYVIGGGPSSGFIEPAFFDNKIAISVNEAWRLFPNVDYIVRKETARAKVSYASGIPMIVSRYNCGALNGQRNQFDGPVEYYVFNHLNNHNTKVDLSVIEPVSTKIVVSYSTITSAMHIAAHMGAANIILVGHDCGKLDGNANPAGYPPPIMGMPSYDKWLQEIEPQSVLVRQKLKEVYDCNMYSLNPFLNFGLEGHRYE